jgi:hypothetical protein
VTLSHAFDTGHHWEVTSQVLQEFGFNDESRQTACVSNWMLDYYSSSPTGSKLIREELSKLHCDNLYDAAAGARYMRRFEENAYLGLMKLVESGAPDREIMMFLGAVLHVVQDLYSHSNWPEIYTSGNTLTSRTWHVAEGRMPGGFLTGAYHPPEYIEEPIPHNHPLHGSYEDGIHKDNHEREYWEQAYYLAYCATYEFMESFRSWITASRWRELQEMKLLPGARWELNGDIRAAYGISLWIDVAGEHGHWKGGESGHKGMFVKSAISFLARSSRNARWYRLRKGYRPLLGGLYDHDHPEKLPTLPRVRGLNLNRRVLIVEIKSMEERGRPLDQGVFGQSDYYLSGGAFYGRVSAKEHDTLNILSRPVKEPEPPVDGEINVLFRDRVIQESSLSEDQWKFMVIADPAKLARSGNITTLNLMIGEEDPGPDDIADASPSPSAKTLTLEYDWDRRQVRLNGAERSRSTGSGNSILFSGDEARNVQLEMTLSELPVR